MNIISTIAMILVLIGGLNWGLVGLFDFDLVSTLFGATILTRIVYILVGISAVWMIFVSASKYRGQ